LISFESKSERKEEKKLKLLQDALGKSWMSMTEFERLGGSIVPDLSYLSLVESDLSEIRSDVSWLRRRLDK
jgi:hypothetical protein